jgi:hypothetical protein
MVFRSRRSRTRQKLRDSIANPNWRIWIHLVIDQGLFHFEQESPKVVTPAEGA